MNEWHNEWSRTNIVHLLTSLNIYLFDYDYVNYQLDIKIRIFNIINAWSKESKIRSVKLSQYNIDVQNKNISVLYDIYNRSGTNWYINVNTKYILLRESLHIIIIHSVFLIAKYKHFIIPLSSSHKLKTATLRYHELSNLAWCTTYAKR